jgi:sporulation protein YlmC with PRC-barrel domain
MPIISIYESKIVGYIHNALFNKKTYKCEYIIVNSTDDIEYLLDSKNIINISKDSITIANKTKLTLLENDMKIIETLSNPINADVHNISGDKLFKIKDILLDSKLKIDKFILDNNDMIASHHIVTFTEKIAIYSKTKLRLSSYKPKSKIVVDTPKKIVVVENNKLNTITNVPTLIGDTKILLNRIALKDMILPNGEILIKHGYTITCNTIKTACKYGKLIELTKFSK